MSSVAMRGPRKRRLERPALLCVALAALAACAPRAVETAPAASPAPEDAPGGERIEFRPSARPIGRYNVPDAIAAPATMFHERIFQLVREHTEALGLGTPTVDGRLCLVADDLARLAGAGRPPPYAAIEFALSRYGVVEPSPQLVVMRTADGNDLQHIAQQLGGRLDHPLKALPPRRMGAGRALAADGSGVIVLVLQQSFVDLEPVARELAAGARVTLRGRVHAPYGSPELFVTLPDGTTNKLALAEQGRGFTASLRCVGAGRQQVEVMAAGPHGPQVVANFPLYCDASAPESLVIAATAAATRDVAEVERRVLELVNAERRRFKLDALVLDPAAAEVAREHSRDMRDNGFVGHVSPRTGGPSERATAAGIRTPLVLENVALAYSAEEAHAGLMSSPGHRANILSGEATHFGIGVTAGAEVAGTPELYVTQLFLRVPKTVDPQEARAAVREAVKERRLQANAGTLRTDEALDEIAQVFAGQLAKTQGKAKPPSLDKAARKYGAVLTLIAVVGTPREAATDAVLAAGAVAYGVGVAQGPHPQLGENAIYVVVLLGQRGAS